jgi:amidohydrolase
VWGAVSAGAAGNVIPSSGVLRGSVRTMDADAWSNARDTVTAAIEAVARATGATVAVDYRNGVPPVVNDAGVIGMLRTGITRTLGEQAITDTEVSMGGEDFGWYLQSVRGAMARLGVRRRGSTDNGGDLHQGSFDVDESAIAVGVRTLVGFALTALGR